MRSEAEIFIHLRDNVWPNEFKNGMLKYISENSLTKSQEDLLEKIIEMIKIERAVQTGMTFKTPKECGHRDTFAKSEYLGFIQEHSFDYDLS